MDNVAMMAILTLTCYGVAATLAAVGLWCHTSDLSAVIESLKAERQDLDRCLDRELAGRKSQAGAAHKAAKERDELKLELADLRREVSALRSSAETYRSSAFKAVDYYQGFVDSVVDSLSTADSISRGTSIHLEEGDAVLPEGSPGDADSA